MARSSRVLPEPEGPSMARHSCAATSKEIGGNPSTDRESTLSNASHPCQRESRPYQARAAAASGMAQQIPRSQSFQRVRGSATRQGSDALAVDLALELLDRLLGTGPVGVHVEQLLEGSQRRLL